MTSAREHIVQMMKFAPAQRDHVPAFRIALSVAIPLLILLFTDHLELAIYSAFGGFTALYARNEPRASRFKHQSQAGIILCLCIAIGMLLSGFHASIWVTTLVCSAIGGVGAMVSTVLNLRPGGSLFHIFATAAVASVPVATHPAIPLAVAIASAGFSVVLGLVSSVVGEGIKIVSTPPPHSLTRNQLLEQGVIYFFVTLIAGCVGYMVGLSHSYWAMVAANAIVVGPNMYARFYRGVQRTVGTFVGVLITAFFVSMHPDQWHMAVLVIVFQFLAEIFVLRNYGFAMLFVTPLALFMIQLAKPLTSYELLTDRMLETAIGAVVGMLAVLVTRSPDKLGQDTVAIPILRAARNVRGSVRSNFDQ